MDKELIKKAYLSEHKKEDFYLDLILGICEQFPKFNLELEDASLWSFFAPEFCEYVFNNIDNKMIVKKFLDFVENVCNDPKDTIYAASETLIVQISNWVEKLGKEKFHKLVYTKMKTTTLRNFKLIKPDYIYN